MRRFPLLPPLLAIVITGIKSAAVSRSLYGALVPGAMAALAWNDLPLLGLVTLFALIGGHKGITGLVFRLVSATVVIWYLADTEVVTMLHTRVEVTEILQYATEVAYTTEGRWLTVFTACLILCMSLVRIGRIKLPFPLFLFIASIALLALPTSRSRPELVDFSTPVKVRAERIRGSEAPRFTPEEIRALSADKPLASAHWREKRNVILVLIESLSAADSHRTSGIFHRLEKLDALSSRGALFKNFYANYLNTEGGIISVFGAVPPLQYPGAGWDLYRSHEKNGSALRFLPPEYRRVFLASSDLGFRGERSYLATLGFADLRDMKNVARFQHAVRSVFLSPADEVLYAEALEILPTLAAPYFLALETTSSHEPYEHPHGGPDTERAVWAYVEEEIVKFAESLSTNGFFENGHLIITGDHRRMDPLTHEETARYGACAAYAVPLMIFGPGIEPGNIDERLLQQTDLLRLLPDVVSGEETLSETLLLAGKYSKPLFGDAPAPALVGVKGEDGAVRCFSGTVFGSKVEGYDGAPAGAVTALKRSLAAMQLNAPALP
ncbi:MAG: sulfatase-like hydrolase/transferase [Candidatus Binatia bacterium]